MGYEPKTKKEPVPRLSIKTAFPRYGDAHVKARPSYLQHGNPYTGNTTSLYWNNSPRFIDARLCQHIKPIFQNFVKMISFV